MFKFHLFFPGLYKILKNNYRVAMTNMTWQREPAFSVGVVTNTSCLFMLKQCLENIGEGLLHACISSRSYYSVDPFINIGRGPYLCTVTTLMCFHSKTTEGKCMVFFVMLSRALSLA